MMSLIRPGIGGSQLDLDQRVVDGLQVGAGDVRQHQILLVGDADFVESIFFGKVGDGFHLAVGDVARRFADALQRDRHRGIVRDAGAW